MTWTAPATPSPTDGPLTGPDRAILEAFLDGQRHTLLGLCAGLTGAQLAERAIASSNLSLLGLVRHLAKVERTWLRERAAAEPVGPLYEPDLGRDHDFNALDPSAAPDDFERYETECRLGDAAVAGLPLDHEFVFRGETYSLRLVYVHLVAEYSRHLGHADLLREAIDGTTGV